LVGDLIGVIGSILLGVRAARRGPVRRLGGSKLGWRVFWSCALIGLYVWVCLFILRPTSGLQVGAFIATIAMFAYVVAGLWLECGFLIALGLAVTAWTLTCFALLPGWFSLAESVGGGGSLLATGVYIRRCWR
jgi:hypothetical protein